MCVHSFTITRGQSTHMYSNLSKQYKYKRKCAPVRTFFFFDSAELFASSGAASLYILEQTAVSQRRTRAHKTSETPFLIKQFSTLNKCSRARACSLLLQCGFFVHPFFPYRGQSKKSERAQWICLKTHKSYAIARVHLIEMEE